MNREKRPTDQYVLGTASPARVGMFVEHLRKATDAFFEDRELGFSDVLMGAHNYHKMMVMDLVDRIAESMEKDGLTDDAIKEAKRIIYQSADISWRLAMSKMQE